MRIADYFYIFAGIMAVLAYLDDRRKIKRLRQRNAELSFKTGETFACALSVNDLRKAAKQDTALISLLMDVNSDMRGGVDVVKHLLLTLPPYIGWEGVEFQLELFNDGGKELRLCYSILSVSPKSRHWGIHNQSGSWNSPFHDGALQSFLYLREGIDSDGDLLLAVRQCREFLYKYKIYYDGKRG